MRWRLWLMAAFIIAILTTVVGPAARANACPTFGGRPTVLQPDGTTCLFGPVKEPVTGIVPQGTVADYWDSPRERTERFVIAGTEITTVHASFKPRFLFADCPVFHRYQTRPEDDHCRLGVLHEPVTDAVPEDFTADYWDSLRAVPVDDAAPGTVITTVDATFWRIPMRIYLPLVVAYQDKGFARCPLDAADAFLILGGRLGIDTWTDGGNPPWRGYQNWEFVSGDGEAQKLAHHGYGDYDDWQHTAHRGPITTDRATFNCR